MNDNNKYIYIKKYEFLKPEDYRDIIIIKKNFFTIYYMKKDTFNNTVTEYKKIPEEFIVNIYGTVINRSNFFLKNMIIDMEYYFKEFYKISTGNNNELDNIYDTLRKIEYDLFIKAIDINTILNNFGVLTLKDFEVKLPQDEKEKILNIDNEIKIINDKIKEIINSTRLLS